MKGIVALAAIVVTGCSAPAVTLPSPSPGASASARATSTAIAVMVDTTSSTDHNHTVYLVGFDGKPIASARAANQTPITSWPAASPIASLWSSYAMASDRRVYYLDGDGTVRFLDTEGTTGPVAQVEGGPTSRSFFAVSPDDQYIAVSTLDYSTPPAVRMRFYVQKLTGGPQQPIQHPENVYFWPIGWHNGRVVVQLGQPFPQTLYGAYPDGATSLWLIDPASGNATTIGTEGCLPQPSLATPAGIVCADTAGNFTVVSWDRNAALFSGHMGTGGASLSTDGRSVATSDAKGLVIITPDGTSRAQVPDLGYPGEAGWLDATHFVFRVAGSTKFAIYDVTAGTETPISVDGTLVGRLPGGL